MDFIAQNYNLVIVLISTLALGLSAGLVGCFLVLRKEALISDAVTHATLPGIGVGFLLSLSLGLEDGRYLPLLLLCSGLTAALGALSVQFINNRTRLSPDAAIAATMSFFYGCGLVIFSFIQNMAAGNKAGLNSFLLGQVSGLTRNDFFLLGLISLIVIVLIVLFFKNLRLLSFDPQFGSLLGLPMKQAERLLIFLMILVVCAGLKTVGLILIIALLIMPAITARLYTDECKAMLFLSAGFGALGCVGGVMISTKMYDLPTGSTIVVTLFSIFVTSLLLTSFRRHNA